MASATRRMFAGDSYPPLRGQASDEAGILNLSTATSLEAVIDATSGPALTAGPGGARVQIVGTAVADQPPIADADGVHFWNWHYGWLTGDTAHVGKYNVYLVVTWQAGSVQTFGPDTLEILEAP